MSYSVPVRLANPALNTLGHVCQIRGGHANLLESTAEQFDDLLSEKTGDAYLALRENNL